MRRVRAAIFGCIVIILSACGGGGGNSSPAPQQSAAPSAPPPQTVSSVTVSGKITYDRVPHAENSGLDYANTQKHFARGVIVEALDGSGKILASTRADSQGAYSFSLKPNTDVQIHVKAQLLSTGQAKWNFQVTDNTQDNQLYALQGSLASTGKNAQQSRDLHAAHGWTGDAYTEPRAAAPFAIIDSIYTAVDALVGIDPDIDLPPLDIRWSVNNRPIRGDKTQGHIGSSAYSPNDDGDAIYVLGEENRDTDEYDPHVILHEWAHYFEDHLSRTDSFGGLHSLNDRLDARVAFSEGWSNAFAAMILKDPIYRDSSGRGQKYGFSFNLETKTALKPGWFSEASISAILYDIFDDAPESSDRLSAGLKPLYSAMTHESFKNTPVFTTIFALMDELRKDDLINTADLNTLLSAHAISGEGPNGNGESNSGAIRSALPVYKQVSFNGPSIELCSVDDAGVYNKLGNREFIFLSLETAQDVTLSAVKSSGDENRDPDFKVWQGAKLLTQSTSSGSGDEVLKTRLGKGDYVIEVYDVANTNGSSSMRGDGCYSFSVKG